MGINIAHLIALYGLWFCVYAAIAQAALLLGLPASWPVLVMMAVAYLATVSMNAPAHVSLATAVFLLLFVAGVLSLPTLTGWSIAGFLALIPVFYKLQSLSHRVWTVAADMSDFNKQFPPGRDLNLILLFYEVPICLNYLVFRRQDWRR
jgi:hypothetical protein